MTSQSLERRERIRARALSWLAPFCNGTSETLLVVLSVLGAKLENVGRVDDPHIIMPRHSFFSSHQRIKTPIPTNKAES